MYERGDTNLFEAMRWIPGIVENGGHAATDLGGLSLRGIGGGGHGTDYMTVMQDGDFPAIRNQNPFRQKPQFLLRLL